jgi:hypothetical protein
VDWQLGGGSESIAAACFRVWWACNAGLADNVDGVDGECASPNVEG